MRFAIPALAARERGGSIPVVATVAGRSTQPLPLVFGRVPLVLSFDPAQATAGELIRIRGAGFGHDPQSNVVSFDGVPALVVAASSTELAVVLPPVIRPSPEFRAPVIVRALGRTSEPGPSFSVLRVEGRWVPRFVAGAADETSTQATVGTEIAPVLLLSSKDTSKSVAARALRLATVLNEAVDRALLGQAVVFEARKLPSPGLALVGAPDLLARVTPEDAVAYGKPPGLAAHEVPPPEAVASRWAALLNDYVVIGTSSGKPSSAAAVSPEAGAALARLRSALPWQYAQRHPERSGRVLAGTPAPEVARDRLHGPLNHDPPRIRQRGRVSSADHAVGC